MIEKRKHIRFSPDPCTVAYVDINISADKFDPKHVGIVITEAYGGCSIAVKATDFLQDKDEIRIKVGEMPVFKAQVVWRVPLDSDIVKLGIKYLE